jgi:hypothetical protein
MCIRDSIYSDGVWVDTQYDAKKMTTLKITYLSAEYFNLAFSNPDVAAGLALGEQVILVIGNEAVEIVE